MELETLLNILMIVGIDLVLGGDNAIVIALASRKLPENKRNKAIIIGTVLAIIVRSSLTIAAVFLLNIPLLQMLGGILLLWIAYKLLADQEQHEENIRAEVTLFSAIRTIVIADFIMGLDNVVAVAGAAHGQFELVVFGLLLSVPIIIWGSKAILILMEKFSFLIYAGAGILAFTAGEMILKDSTIAPLMASFPKLEMFLPYLSILLILGIYSFTLLFKEKTH